MSFYNLDRFRFERKRKATGQWPSAAKVLAGSSAAESSAAGDDADEATDDGRELDAPASDVTGKSGYVTIPETPEDKRPKKKPCFKHQRGVQFIDVSSDSEGELPRSFSTSKENTAPRRNAVVISEQSDEESEDGLCQLACAGDPMSAVKKGVEKDIRAAKLQTPNDFFPEKNDQELRDVVMLFCSIFMTVL